MSILNKIFLIKGQIFLSESFLAENLKLSKPRVTWFIKKNKNFTKDIKTSPISKKEFVLSYPLVWDEFFYYCKMPSEDSIRRQYDKAIKEKARFQRKLIKERIDEYIELFLHHYYRAWKKERDIYSTFSIENDIIEKYCKTHALLKASLKLKEDGYMVKDIYRSYKKYKDLIFIPKRYESFANKLKVINNEESIQKNLFHKLIGRISNNHVLKPDVITEIKKSYANPKTLNASHVLDDVNQYLIKKNRKPISRSSVERVIATKYVQNEVAISRKGIKYAREKLFPQFYFDKPQSNGLIWAIDGSRLQFMYLNENNEYKFTSYFVVLDGHSDKILGYSFGEHENTQMVIDAIKMACNETKYLPTEIIHDNSTAFTSNKISSLISYSKFKGVYWRAINPGNSRDNGYVERFFGVFQETICKRCDGYIGDGITSKNPNGKPSPEEIKKYSSKSKVRTLEQLKSQVSDLINEYNNKKNRDGESPNTLSKKNISESVIKINTVLYSQMFWPSKEITIRNNCVTITHLNKTYRYNNYDEEIALKFGDNKILVRYNPEDFKYIFLFDLKKDTYITKLPLFKNIPKAAIERSKEDNIRLKEHISKVKELQNHLETRCNEIINSSKKNNESLPPELTEIIPLKKLEVEKGSDLNTIKHLKKINKKIKNKKKVKKISFENMYRQKATLKIVSK